MKLRYLGGAAVTFLSPPIGTVEPGEEFWVSDEDADRMTRRSDVEIVGEEPTEDTEEPPGDESTPGGSEAQETPTERQDDATPAKRSPRRATKTDSSGSADNNDR